MNIHEEGELNRDATVSKMEIVVNRGYRGEVTELIDFYNLDAISGQTATEIIYTHADRTKDHKGLTTWKNSPNF